MWIEDLLAVCARKVGFTGFIRINTIFLQSVQEELSVVFLILLCCACSKAPETLVKGGYDEEEMEAAIARARSEVDSFIAEMSKGNGTDFAVKVPIEDKDEIEHFWLTDIVYRNGKFEGKIGNEPGMVTNVKEGQKWSVGFRFVGCWQWDSDCLRPADAHRDGDRARHR